MTTTTLLLAGFADAGELAAAEDDAIEMAIAYLTAYAERLRADYDQALARARDGQEYRLAARQIMLTWRGVASTLARLDAIRAARQGLPITRQKMPESGHKLPPSKDD
jgi:hypothetical protein